MTSCSSWKKKAVEEVPSHAIFAKTALLCDNLIIQQASGMTDNEND